MGTKRAVATCFAKAFATAFASGSNYGFADSHTDSESRFNQAN